MRKNETSYFDLMTEQEEENSQKTQKELRQEIKLYQDSLNLLIEILDNLYPTIEKSANSLMDPILLMIMSKIIMSLKSFFNLVIKGYYHEAMVISRNTLESVLLCILVTEKEEYALKWLKGKVTPCEVRKALELKGDVNLKDLYRRMSQYVHVNLRSFDSIVELEIEREKGKMSVNWVPRFKKDWAYSFFIHGISYIFLLILHLSTLYKDILKEILIDKISRHRKRVEEKFKEFQSEFLRE